MNPQLPRAQGSPRARRRRPHAIAIAVVTLAALANFAPAAAATSTCSFNQSTHTATISVPTGPPADLIVGTPGEVILVDGAACGAATVYNTDTIAVSGPVAGEGTIVAVHLAGGPFAPGFTDESGDSDEIEWTFDAGIRVLVLYGTAGVDSFVQGTLGVNLNAAEAIPDLDIAVAGQLGATWFGEGGSDFLSTVGGAATGGPVTSGISELYGGEGDDTLWAGWTGDLYGGPGGDSLACGARAEEGRLNYDYSPSGVDVDLVAGGPPTFAGGDATGDTNVADDCEGIVGSAHDDILAGDGGRNLIIGLAGDDQLLGRGGRDALSGWDGDDTLDGGPGDDSMFGGDQSSYYLCAAQAEGDLLLWAAGDTVTYANGPGPVQVDLGAGTATGAQGNDTIEGVEGIVGSPGGDLLKGNAARNVIVGGHGHDTINGAAGNDCLGGEAGDDFVSGSLGRDTLHGGSGDDVLHGNRGRDGLAGGSGGDALLGQRGNDMLYANDDEFDTVMGGPGVDGADADRVGDGSPVADLVKQIEFWT